MICCHWCGKFENDDYGWDYGNLLCPKCLKIKILIKMKEKIATLKSQGYKFESYKKRARKAYYTRMANMYFKDPNRFSRLVQNISGSKKAQITKRIKERSLKNGV